MENEKSTFSQTALKVSESAQVGSTKFLALSRFLFKIIIFSRRFTNLHSLTMVIFVVIRCALRQLKGTFTVMELLEFLLRSPVCSYQTLDFVTWQQVFISHFL